MNELCKTCGKEKPVLGRKYVSGRLDRFCLGQCHPPREERCDGSGVFITVGENVAIDFCPGCDNCRNQEAAKCGRCKGVGKVLVYHGTWEQWEKEEKAGHTHAPLLQELDCPSCPAHGAAKGEEESEVSKYDGNKRCYFGVWLLDKVTELAVASEEKFSEQKKGSVIAAYIEQEADAILKEVDALLALTRSRSEKVGEARRTDEILNWLKQALWEEEFSKVEMVINGHLKSAAKDDGHQVG